MNSGTANAGIFIMDSLGDGNQGCFLSHTQDQERNIEEVEKAQAQSSVPRPVPPLSPLPVKVLLSSAHFLEFGGERTGGGA